MPLEVADSVDWTAKDSLEFNDIWETLLLNIRWKKEMEGESVAGRRASGLEAHLSLG